MNIVPRDMQDDEWSVAIATAADALGYEAPDMVTPDLLGEMDAQDNYPFCPEMYYIKHSDMCLYAAGYATVAGPSCLTDAFLLGSESDAVEHDAEWIRGGC